MAAPASDKPFEYDMSPTSGVDSMAKPSFSDDVDPTESIRVAEVPKDEASSPSQSSPVTNGFPPFIQHLKGWRLLVVQICLMFGLFLSAMESSIVATALVTIAIKFNDYIKVQWVVLSYLLTYMGFSVIITRSSDVFGRKWTFLSCVTIFGVFSLACGLATTMSQLIGFRTVQGIGGSGLFAMCMVCLPELTPPKYFPAMSGGIGATFAFSSVLGPLLGGVITRADWRWIFFLNIPPCVLIFIAILIAWRREEHSATKRVPLGQVDYLGAILLLAASVLVIFALQEAGATTYAWNSSIIITTLTIGACCWVAFAAWVWYLGEPREEGKIQSVLPISIFRNHTISCVIVSTLLTGYAFISVLIELPQRFQIVNQESSVTAGIHLLPMLIASALGSLSGGVINSRKDFTFYTLNVASSLILLGCGLLSTLPVSFDVSRAQYGYQFVFGLGVGLTFSTATVMTTRRSKPSDRAAAQGAVSQARIFGGSIGLAVATIILNAHLSESLKDILSPQQLANLRQSLSTILQLTPVQQGAVVAVFATSFNVQLRICTYVAAAALLFSLSTYSRQHGTDYSPRPTPIQNKPEEIEPKEAVLGEV